MKKLRNLFAFLIILLAGLFGFSAVAATTTPISINSQGSLGPGLSYQVKGNISSIADINNGNLSTSIFVDKSVTAQDIRNQILKGPLEIAVNSQLLVQQGKVTTQTTNAVQFAVNIGNPLPSLLITNVAQTQLGTSIDVLISIQKLAGATATSSLIQFSKGDDGSISIDQSGLAGDTISYQFQNSQTHQPFNLLMFPVIADVDWTQKFSLNGTVLGYGSNLSEDSSGLFTSDGTGTNGYSDFPLGGILYEFYGNTMISSYTPFSTGAVDSGTSNFSLFGIYGSVQAIKTSYTNVKPQGTLTLNYLNTQTGLPLLPSEQYTNKIGDWQTIHVPNIPNYHVVDTGNEIAFQQLLPEQTRNIYYDPDLDTVKVDFVNQEGAMIAPSETLTGYYGSSRLIKAQPIQGYQVAAGEMDSYPLDFNQPYQHIVFKYQPIKESITFRFVNDIGQQVYAPVTITGDYGSFYSYSPKVPWFDSLTYAGQQKIVGKYSQPKADITVYYTRRQASVTIIDKDDWGNVLNVKTLTSYENYRYSYTNPSYWYLRLKNPAQQTLSGIYKTPRATITVIYQHIPAYLHTTITINDMPDMSFTLNGYLNQHATFKIPNLNNVWLSPFPGPTSLSWYFTQVQNYYNVNYVHNVSTITFEYVDSNGAYLGSGSETEWAGTIHTFYVPNSIGDYHLAGSNSCTEFWMNSNQTIDIYYVYVPPRSSGSPGRGSGPRSNWTAPFDPDNPWGPVSQNGSSNTKTPHRNVVPSLVDAVGSFFSSLLNKAINYIKDDFVEGLAHFVSKSLAKIFVTNLTKAINLPGMLGSYFTHLDFLKDFQNNHNVLVSEFEVSLDGVIDDIFDDFTPKLSLRAGAQAFVVALDTGILALAAGIGLIVAGIVEALSWALKTVIEDLLNDFIDEEVKKLEGM